MTLLLLSVSAYGACDPVVVADVGPDAHAVSMAEVGDATALAWIDEAGGHLLVVDAAGRTTMPARALGPAVEILVLGDAEQWVAVTRTSQWAGRDTCRIQATRTNAKGNRPEHRTLVSDACARETPALAAVLREGTLIVAATTADPPGATSRDLRITRWAPAPALPQPLDAVYTESGLRVEGLAATADGLDLFWAAGTDHRRSILDPSGVPRGTAQHSTTPFVEPAPEAGEWVAAPSGRGASIAGGTLRFRSCVR